MTTDMSGAMPFDDEEHDEVATLLGAYALDAVDADEKARVEAHLAVCPRCAAEVADHREVASMLANPGEAAPDGVWSRILESLEDEPPALSFDLRPPGVERPSDEALPSGGPVVDFGAERRRRRPSGGSSPRWLPVASAAAVVAVLAFVVGVAVGGNSPGTSERAADFTLEALAREAVTSDGARKVTLSSESGDLSATAAIDQDGVGYLLGTTLPALDAARTYQLWAIRDGVAISLGVLGPAPSVIAFHVDESVEALAITEEMAGGVPSSVNPPLLVGEVS